MWRRTRSNPSRSLSSTEKDRQRLSPELPTLEPPTWGKVDRHLDALSPSSTLRTRLPLVLQLQRTRTTPSSEQLQTLTPRRTRTTTREKEKTSPLKCKPSIPPFETLQTRPPLHHPTPNPIDPPPSKPLNPKHLHLPSNSLHPNKLPPPLYPPLPNPPNLPPTTTTRTKTKLLLPSETKSPNSSILPKELS